MLDFKVSPFQSQSYKLGPQVIFISIGGRRDDKVGILYRIYVQCSFLKSYSKKKLYHKLRFY
jgi:hypothetical protein